MIRAVLAYCNSFILFKLLILNDNCLRLFLACGRKEVKKTKPIKSKRKTYDLSHQKTVFQNEYHAKEPCTFWQHYCLVVVRFFLFSTFPAGFFVWTAMMMMMMIMMIMMMTLTIVTQFRRQYSYSDNPLLFLYLKYQRLLGPP